VVFGAVLLTVGCEGNGAADIDAGIGPRPGPGSAERESSARTEAEAFCNARVAAHSNRLRCQPRDDYVAACLQDFMWAHVNDCSATWLAYWTCVAERSTDCRTVWLGCEVELLDQRAACRDPCADGEPPAEFSCRLCGTFKDPIETWRCPSEGG
jgi:hypothetical protein